MGPLLRSKKTGTTNHTNRGQLFPPLVPAHLAVQSLDWRSGGRLQPSLAETVSASQCVQLLNQCDASFFEPFVVSLLNRPICLRLLDGMNYFAHGMAFLDEPYFLAGTAVPDWLNVADRKVRLRREQVLPWADGSGSPIAQFAAGILRHLDDDDWFHAAPGFEQVAGELTKIFPRAPQEVHPKSPRRVLGPHHHGTAVGRRVDREGSPTARRLLRCPWPR